MSSAQLVGPEVAEVTLLLPADALAELEALAREHGLTVGQFLRRQVAAVLRAAGRLPGEEAVGPAPRTPPVPGPG